MPFGANADLFYFLVVIEIGELHRYLDVMTDYLADTRAKLEVLAENRLRVADIDENDEYAEEAKEYLLEDLQGEFEDVNHSFPRRLFYGFIVNWHTFVEDKLFQVCDHINADHYDLKQRGKPCFRESGIHLAVCAISQTIRRNIKVSNLWYKLTLASKVRNIIAHNNGRIYFSLNRTKDKPHLLDEKVVDQALQKYLEQHKILYFSGNGATVSPNLEYCQELLDLSYQFLEYVYRETGLRK